MTSKTAVNFATRTENETDIFIDFVIGLYYNRDYLWVKQLRDGQY